MKLNQLLSNLHSKNYKAFSLFLFLTLILWFIIQMTKTYALKSQIGVEIKNIPKYIIIDSLNSSFDVTVESNGLKMWQYNISDKKYSIDYSEVKKDTLKLIIKSEDIKDYIVDRFGLKNDQIQINQDVFNLSYKRKASKYVPVKSDFEIDFAPGYNSLSTVVIEPDSILVSGAKSALDEISEIKTDKVKLKQVNKNVNKTVDLLSPSEQIALERKQVDLSLEVEKFSENSIFVDLQIKNKPDSLELNIFPEKAKLFFLVSLQDYDKVSKMDFRVVCDYEKRFQENGIMIPEIEKYPDNILEPKLNINKVDYLIRKANE